MNIVIVKTLTSKPAMNIYKNVGIGALKVAGAVTGQVVTYFAAHKIIKTISKKTDFEPSEPVTVNVHFLNDQLTAVEV